jgi:hypothetical protein
MRWEWRMFWLRLYTSKYWVNGNAPGRVIGVWFMANASWIGIMIYKIFYKNEEWNNGYFSGLILFNGFMLSMSLLLTIHSIFKEKMHKEFWNLVKHSIRTGWINR